MGAGINYTDGHAKTRREVMRCAHGVLKAKPASEAKATEISHT